MANRWLDLGISQDGRRLAGTDVDYFIRDNTIRIWDLRSRKLEVSWQVPQASAKLGLFTRKYQARNRPGSRHGRDLGHPLRQSIKGHHQMKSLQISVVIWAATLVPSPAPAVNIETVLVGNPGNAADTQMMSDGTTGYGAVPYEYRIGKYEVTNAQYAEFLNTKDPTGIDTLNLNLGGTVDRVQCGINFNAAAVDGTKHRQAGAATTLSLMSPGTRRFASPIGYITDKAAGIPRRGPTRLGLWPSVIFAWQ